MFAFLRRDCRLGASDAELAALIGELPDRYRMIELQDRLIDSNARIRSLDRDWKNLTDGQRMLFLLAQFDMEVLNGGIEQYFWNSPDTIFDLHEAFLKLGDTRLVAAYESALDKLAAGHGSWLQLRAQFRGKSKEDSELFLESSELLDLEEFDDSWYGEWDGHGTQLALGLGDLLPQRMIEWILANPREFCAGSPNGPTGGTRRQPSG